MFPDFRRFSLHRELFPRDNQEVSTKLLCGHLNRLKFSPRADVYLLSRKQGASMSKAMAQARRCHCGQEKQKSQSDKQGGGTIEEKQLIQQLQEMQIFVKVRE